MVKGKFLTTGVIWVLAVAIAVFLILYNGGPMIGWFLAGLAVGFIGGVLFGVWMMMQKDEEGNEPSQPNKKAPRQAGQSVRD
jgi:peptidoglycan/LPS O-acetylase OafA/YrhL